MNNAHCRNWPGVMSNAVLSVAMLMVSSSRWETFFDVVDSNPPPGPMCRSCHTRV